MIILANKIDCNNYVISNDRRQGLAIYPRALNLPNEDLPTLDLCLKIKLHAYTTASHPLQRRPPQTLKIVRKEVQVRSLSHSFSAVGIHAEGNGLFDSLSAWKLFQ